ncbi:MAG TPA: glycosyltransferase family 2 protein [Candidatus Kapabacteria bacterium]|nr:glycosyltransferase family 2 protein [Candidatus Kapabacteria bacterium]
MTLSIIIPTFNRREILTRLLRMLHDDEESKAAIDYEIIVVDDRSTDGTWDMVSSEFPGVKLIQGQGKNAEIAKRAAVEVSVGDYIVCLDDDSMPKAGWLSHVRESLRKGEKIVQAKIIWTDLGQKECRDETNKKTFRTGFRFDMMPVALLYGGYRRQYINICHEFGCFVARDVLTKVPLDDRNLMFHHLGESGSFYLRASKAGFRVLFEPSCVIEHLGALAGGCLERSEKQPPKKNCNEYTIGVVHNLIVLARMYQPTRIFLLIPYYIAGGLYLSIKQRKNCFKYFARGLIMGLTQRFVPVIPYDNID